MRIVFNSHSEEKISKKLRPIAIGIAVMTPGVSLLNSTKTLATGLDLFGNQAGDVDYFLSAIGVATFGIGCIENISPILKIANKSTGIFSDLIAAYRTYRIEQKNEKKNKAFIIVSDLQFDLYIINNYCCSLL